MASMFDDFMRDFGRPQLKDFLNNYPHEITIEQRLKFKDSFGQMIPQPPSVFATAVAKVVDEAGGEATNNTQLVNRNDMTLEMLYIAGVTTVMEVVFDGRRFEIVRAWSPGERKVYTRLRVREQK